MTRPIGIIGAMAAEAEYLKNRLGSLKTRTIGKAFTFHTGTLHGRPVVLSQSGIGKVNAAIATALMIELHAPSGIINTGSAGGIGAGLKVGDIIIGTAALHHDADATTFGYAYGQIPQQPENCPCDPALMQAAEAAAGSLNRNARITRGIIASGDQFVSSAAAVTQIRTRFPTVQAVEMEAAAIAQTCYQLNTPCAIIRAVSDSADDEAHISFDEFLATAALHSAQMVEALVKAL